MRGSTKSQAAAGCNPTSIRHDRGVLARTAPPPLTINQTAWTEHARHATAALDDERQHGIVVTSAEIDAYAGFPRVHLTHNGNRWTLNPIPGEPGGHHVVDTDRHQPGTPAHVNADILNRELGDGHTIADHLCNVNETLIRIGQHYGNAGLAAIIEAANTGPGYTAYAVGIAVDETGRIAFIRKLRPAWMAGLLNCPGGHIEEHETGIEAVRREFREETGVDIAAWRHLVNVAGTGYHVEYYTAHITHDTMNRVHTTTDEPTEVHHWNHIPTSELAPKLEWVIPLAGRTAEGNSEPFAVREH